jgi:hypothetical protein
MADTSWTDRVKLSKMQCHPKRAKTAMSKLLCQRKKDLGWEEKQQYPKILGARCSVKRDASAIDGRQNWKRKERQEDAMMDVYLEERAFNIGSSPVLQSIMQKV